MPMRDGVRSPPTSSSGQNDAPPMAVSRRSWCAPYGKVTEAARLGDSVFARHGYVVVSSGHPRPIRFEGI
jgi:hypothetical protein